MSGIFVIIPGSNGALQKNYDICFNSASYGIEESVEIIDRMLHKHLHPGS